MTVQNLHMKTSWQYMKMILYAENIWFLTKNFVDTEAKGNSEMVY